MPIDHNSAVQQIAGALIVYSQLCNGRWIQIMSSLPFGEGDALAIKERNIEFQKEYSDALCRLRTTLERLAPPGTIYEEESKKSQHYIHKLAGILQSLQSDYIGGYFHTFKAIIRSEVFTDFLSQAEFLLREELLEAAAVIAGGVLEEHLRKLADKNGIPVNAKNKAGEDVPRPMNALNQDLYSKGIYQTNMLEQIKAWAALRNAAAHVQRDKVTLNADQVALMIPGIRAFLSAYPA